MSFQPPSSLFKGLDETKVSALQRNFNNKAMKVGMVVEIFDIDDEKNISKIIPEYNVITIEQNGEFGLTPVTYNNCVCMDAFGGIADFKEAKLRKSEKDFKKKYDFNLSDGYMVLLLMLDGFSEKPIILGGLPHPNRKPLLDKEKGLHAEGEYNGIRWSIDKDGAFTFTFKGATDINGKPKDSAAGGTVAKVEKDGSFEINNNKLSAELAKGNKKPEGKEEAAKEEEKGEGIQYEAIRLDKTKKTISAQSREDMTFKTDKNLNITTKESVNITTEKDWMAKITGSANHTIESDYMVECKANYKFKAANIQMESDDQVMLKGGSSVLIDSTSIQVGLGGTPAVIMSTQYLGTGNLGQPVLSLSIGPWSSVVLVAP